METGGSSNRYPSLVTRRTSHLTQRTLLVALHTSHGACRTSHIAPPDSNAVPSLLSHFSCIRHPFPVAHSTPSHNTPHSTQSTCHMSHAPRCPYVRNTRQPHVLDTGESAAHGVVLRKHARVQVWRCSSRRFRHDYACYYFVIFIMMNMVSIIFIIIQSPFLLPSSSSCSTVDPHASLVTTRRALQLSYFGETTFDRAQCKGTRTCTLNNETIFCNK